MPIVCALKPNSSCEVAHYATGIGAGHRKAQSTVEKELLEEINASRQARAFENVIETVERIIVSRSTDRTQLSELFIARILHCKADAQEQLGHFQAVVATCEEVVVRFGDSVVPSLQWRVAEALMDLGRMRREMGDLDAATAAFEEVVERFGDSEVSDLQWWVAVALIYKGTMRRELGDPKGAIAANVEVVERFGDSDASDLQCRVAEALGMSRTETGRFGRSRSWCVRRWWKGLGTATRVYLRCGSRDRQGNDERRTDPKGAIAANVEVVESYVRSPVGSRRR